MPNRTGPGPLPHYTFSLLALASAQQQPPLQQQYGRSRSSPQVGAAVRPLTSSSSTALTPETADDRPLKIAPTYKRVKDTLLYSENERAVATIAPADSNPAVRAP